MALSQETKQLRQNRQSFRTQYGKTTEEIIKRIAKGQNSQEIADTVGVRFGSVVTTKGNFTRDAYYPYAYYDESGRVVGACQY